MQGKALLGQVYVTSAPATVQVHSSAVLRLISLIMRCTCKLAFSARNIKILYPRSYRPKPHNIIHNYSTYTCACACELACLYCAIASASVLVLFSLSSLSFSLALVLSSLGGIGYGCEEAVAASAEELIQHQKYLHSSSRGPRYARGWRIGSYFLVLLSIFCCSKKRENHSGRLASGQQWNHITKAGWQGA